MGGSIMAFKKGLQDWTAARNAFTDFSEAEQSENSETVEDSQWLNTPKVEGPEVRQLNEQVDKLMDLAFGNIDDNVKKFFDTMESKEDNDFSRMEPLELERLILSIQKAIYVASGIVAERYNAAYWSDRIQQDEYWKAYREPKSVKAKEDRQSYAMEQTREERFAYYIRFMLWRRLSEKLNSLKDLCRTLEFYQQRNSKRY